MNAAQPSETDLAAQFDVVRRLITRGYSVSAYGPCGEVVLTHGEDYTPGPTALLLSVLTMGVWIVVIALRAAFQRRRVVTVWPDGSTTRGP